MSVAAAYGEYPHRGRGRCYPMSILWIILIVVLVLALLGFFGRGRAW
jgi:flagellar basal body-associated protein FliL